MEENKKIKQELCDMLFDVQQKLTDAEYKDLVETLAKIEDLPVSVLPSAPPVSVLPSAPPVSMLPSAPSVSESLLDKIKNLWKKKPCTYPKCTNTYDEIYTTPYCGEHLKSNYKKTSDQRCNYFNLEKVQCLNKAKVGQNYCSHHINNHTPKPAKKIVTENYKCSYVIPPKTKNGIGKCCSKYAMLGQKYCHIHIDTVI